MESAIIMGLHSNLVLIARRLRVVVLDCGRWDNGRYLIVETPRCRFGGRRSRALATGIFIPVTGTMLVSGDR